MPTVVCGAEGGLPERPSWLPIMWKGEGLAHMPTMQRRMCMIMWKRLAQRYSHDPASSPACRRHSVALT